MIDAAAIAGGGWVTEARSSRKGGLLPRRADWRSITSAGAAASGLVGPLLQGEVIVIDIQLRLQTEQTWSRARFDDLDEKTGA